MDNGVNREYRLVIIAILSSGISPALFDNNTNTGKRQLKSWKYHQRLHEKTTEKDE
jgi:hypothetical protein